jgi:hypothetical protein
MGKLLSSNLPCRGPRSHAGSASGDPSGTNDAFTGTVNNAFQDYCLENYGSYKTDETKPYQKAKIKIVVYPNPSNNTSGFYVNSNEFVKAELYDYMGRVIGSFVINNGTTHVPTSGLPYGVYLLKCKMQNDEVITKRIAIE